MNKRNVIVGALIGLVAIVGGAAWWLGFFSDSPEEVSLEAAIEAVATTEAPEAESDAPAATQAQADEVEVDEVGPSDVSGEWVVQANADATFVGFRINEVLNTIGDFEVVGRTSDVAGSVTIDDTTITGVSVVAQMGTLETDSSSRDSALRNQALETSEFPEASFTLTSPIELDSVPAEGVAIEVTATGDMVIHGVTQSVEFPLQAQLVGGSIVVVGQLNVLLADYEIEPPRAPIVASVEDNAILELSLVLSK